MMLQMPNPDYIKTKFNEIFKFYLLRKVGKKIHRINEDSNAHIYITRSNLQLLTRSNLSLICS